MSKHCGKEHAVQEQTQVTISSHDFSVIPNCLNCSFLLNTAEDSQVLASLMYIRTEQEKAGVCDLNRLDFFDGPTANQSRLLSRMY